jgi:hypothetical protein
MLLERAWFAPLLRALRERRLTRLAVAAIGADHCVRFDVTPHRLLRFWRVCPGLASYATGFEI